MELYPIEVLLFMLLFFLERYLLTSLALRGNMFYVGLWLVFLWKGVNFLNREFGLFCSQGFTFFVIDSIGGERTISVSLSIEPLQPRSDLSKASEEGNLET